MEKTGGGTEMTQLFCDCCGDVVKAIYPCSFVFHDKIVVPFNICPDCMKNGELRINLPRKRLISKILKRLEPKRLWRNRGNANFTRKT